MIKTKNNFYYGIVLILALFYLAQWALVRLGKPDYVSPFYWWIQGYSIVITCVSHWLTSKGLSKRNDFHLYFMGSMTIRMLAALFFLLVFVLYLTENQEVFVINFIVAYFAYTGFEIYYLLTNLRPDSEKNENKDF
jgi:cobalamin biosynthesis protein CobD/CbiB